MADWPVHGTISGPLVMIGFGSIGRGMLPLLERHFNYDRSRFTVIDPEDKDRHLLDERQIRYVKDRVKPDNVESLVKSYLTQGEGQAFLVNLSVDVSSVAMMRLCHEIGALYIDTVAEPWLGFYTDPRLTLSQRSNYALREAVLDLRRAITKEGKGKGSTAISCCGANPGMVSWFVKQALVNVAADLGIDAGAPKTSADWAALMHKTGVKGIHIAERDTQRALTPKPMGTFVNTWSVEGFISEGVQPAELGWGTFEKHMPPEGKRHDFGPDCAIYLMRPGAGTKVRSWTPTAKAQHGYMITHNESISIADYFTLKDGEKVVFRPTCHYAYRPADDAVLSLEEMAGNQWKPQEEHHILEENEIADGIDELGVLLYGHAKNAYWYGSQLSIDETRVLAPYQNATGMQVTSAVLAGMVHALENPNEGILEADELDYRRCLEIQMPYLGPVIGAYTDWTPLVDRGVLFPEDLDEEDPWQFKNVIVR